MNLRTYLLLQVPGWILAVLVVAALYHWFGLSIPMSFLLLALWVGKDIALYPLYRNTFNADLRHGHAPLIGSRGIVREVIDPKGYISIGGELWRAESSREEAIPAGSAVRVREARGLTLIVEAAEDPKPG